MHDLLQQGLDVRGYHHWTLVDNFEWDAGWDLRFGLYELDLATQARKVRRSGRFLPKSQVAMDSIARRSSKTANSGCRRDPRLPIPRHMGMRGRRAAGMVLLLLPFRIASHGRPAPRA